MRLKRMQPATAVLKNPKHPLNRWETAAKLSSVTSGIGEGPRDSGIGEGLRDAEEDFCNSEEQLGDAMMLFVTKREGY